MTLEPERLKSVSRNANVSWLAALIISIMGTLHKLRLNNIKLEMEKKALVEAKKASKDVETVKGNLAALSKERFTLGFAAVQDGLDAFIPASSLEYVKVDPGNVALFASITSIMGACTSLQHY